MHKSVTGRLTVGGLFFMPVDLGFVASQRLKGGERQVAGRKWSPERNAACVAALREE